MKTEPERDKGSEEELSIGGARRSVRSGGGGGEVGVETRSRQPWRRRQRVKEGIDRRNE